MTTSQSTRPWSVPVRVDEIPETGRHYQLVADDRVRAAVVELADLRALPRLEAVFDLSRHGRDGLRVVGQISATVGQVCGVSLEPIENEVEEAIDLVFRPQSDLDVAESANAATVGRDVEVTMDDAPEPLVNGVVDLGMLATEFMILGIDPYPRKPDAVFEPPSAPDEMPHPFAALATLKKGQDER